MGETIRDVVIRVSLQNGNMALGPVDLTQVTSAIQSIKHQFDSVGNFNQATVSQTAFVEAARETVRAIQEVEDVSARAAVAVESISRNALKIGMPGYGQSVRDRASESAIQVIEQMQQSGMAGDLSEEEFGKLHDTLSRRALPMVREQDRETAKGQRAEDRDRESAVNYRHSVYQERERKRAQEAKEAEREETRRQNDLWSDGSDGIKSWSRSKQEQAAREREEEKQRANEIKYRHSVYKQREQEREREEAEAEKNQSQEVKYRHSVYKSREQQRSSQESASEREEMNRQNQLWREGEEGIRSWSRAKAEAAEKTREATSAVIGMARGLGHLSVATGLMPGEMTKLVVGIEGVTQVAKSAQSVFEVFGATGLTVGGVVAAVAAGLLVYRSAVVVAREETQKYNEQLSNMAAGANAYQGAKATRAAGNALELNANTHDQSRFSLMPDVHKARDAFESKIRSDQAGSTRDFGWRQEIRRRGEFTGQLYERQTLGEASTKELDTKAEKNKAARAALEKSKTNSAEAYISQMKLLDDEHIKPTKSWTEEYRKEFRKDNSSQSWLERQNEQTDVWLGGGVTEKMAETHNKNVTIRTNTAEAQRRTQLKDESDKGAGLAREALQIDQQRAETANQLLNVTREAVQEARRLAELDRERVSAGKRSVGMLSVGERHRLEMIQGKADRGEKLTHAQMQFGSRFDTPLADQIRKQAEDIGSKSKVKFHTKEAKESEDKAKEAERIKNHNAPIYEDRLKGSVNGVQDDQKQLIQAIKDGFSIKEVLEAVKEVIRANKEDLENFKMKGGHS